MEKWGGEGGFNVKMRNLCKNVQTYVKYQKCWKGKKAEKAEEGLREY